MLSRSWRSARPCGVAAGDRTTGPGRSVESGHLAWLRCPVTLRRVVMLLPLRAQRERVGARSPVERERSEEHTSELQSPCNLVCRLLLEKKKQKQEYNPPTPSTPLDCTPGTE